jgi:methionyl-tRNA formyltransferase
MRKLKIVLITQGVSRIVKPIVTGTHEVVGILESAPRKYVNVKRSLLYESYKMWKGVFQSHSELQGFCDEKKIPYRMMYSSDDEGLESWLHSLRPDLIVVYSMSRLLKKNIFSIPSMGAINLHPSYLPDYKGPNPCFWQYYDLEMSPGVTVHFINEGEDSGDIILQGRVRFPLGIKSPERLDKLVGELGVRLLITAIDLFAKKNIEAFKQTLESNTIRARNLKPSEHKEIIDWDNWNGARIWHILRGTESWLDALPQPKGLFRGQRWIIDDFISREVSEKPGSINKNYPYKVFTKDGYISLRIKFNWKLLVREFLL